MAGSFVTFGAAAGSRKRYFRDRNASWFFQVLLLLFLLPLAGTAQAKERNSAGFRFLSVAVGPDRIPVAVSYPATAKAINHRIGPFTLRVAQGAPLARGRHGIILLSHGAGGGNLNHRTKALALARAGWIVAAPEHPGGNWRDGSRIGTHADFEGRPRHLKAVLDRILAHPVFGKAVDANRVGALGYSIGGYTVLAAIGGRPDVARLARHCVDNLKKDRQFCSYRKGAAAMPRLKIVPDRRIRAAVVVAPAGAIFGPGAFDGATARIRVYRADKDEELAYPFHAENIRALLPKGADYRVLKGLGHFTFISRFPEGLKAMVGRVARDPPGVDRVKVHKWLNAEIVAYFNTVLPR